MLLNHPALISVFVYFFAFTRIVQAASPFCPPLGPVLPAPQSISNHELTKSTGTLLTDNLNRFVRSLNSTFISISLTSIHEDTPLFEYHRSAPAYNTTGTSKVDADSIYRIASITKLVTVFSLLLSGKEVAWTDPITKYVPELAAAAGGRGNSSDEGIPVQWDEITIEALASQVGGIGRSYGFGDLAPLPAPWRSIGLPYLEDSELPQCGNATSQSPCSKEEILTGFAKRNPVYAPFTTPVYSNMAYALLGLVIEAVTGQSYEDAVRSLIFDPLGMDRTSVTLPSQSNQGVIPLGESEWEFSLGVLAPTGELYSSTRDLTRLGTAILNNTLLSPAATRRWMKPKAHSASFNSSVGAPWEIFRSDKVTQDGRIIDFYTKNGLLGLYSSHLVLVPDYDLVLTVMTAGPGPLSSAYANRVTSAFLPVVETIGKEEARAIYAGNYKSGNSSLTLAVDDGPGLKVTSWFNNGVNVLRADFSSLLGATASLTPGISVRMYSTNVVTNNPKRRSFRAVVDFSGADPSIVPDDSTGPVTSSSRAVSFGPTPTSFGPSPFSGPDTSSSGTPSPSPSPSSTSSANGNETDFVNIFADPCLSWGLIDGYMYGSKALDEFIFTLDDDGSVASAVELPGWRSKLQRSGA